MSRNILYISYDGMTDPLGQSQVLPYLTGLRKKGYAITLLSFEKPDAFLENESLIRQICTTSDIEWHPLRYTKKPPLLSTLFDIWKMKAKAAAIHREKSIDIVHCRSYISAIAGLWLKQKFRVRFVFDMRGFWPDERVDGNLWDLKNPLYKQVYNLFKRREIQFLQQADHTICLTQAAEQEIHSWRYVKNNPVEITVIPCCADMGHFNPERISSDVKAGWRKTLNISESDRVISYVGSIGTWYMPDEMLDFFNVLLETEPTMRFLFITRDDPSILLELATKKNIDPAKIIIHSGSRSDMPALISLSDYTIFFIKPTYSKKASSPTKQAEIMRIGIPLICNDLIGDTTYIVNKYKAGVVLQEFDTHSYHAAIKTLGETIFDVPCIQKGAMEVFSLETGISRYDSVYEAVLDN